MKLVWLFVGLPLLCVGPLASAETAAYEPFAPLRVTKCEVAADLARPIRVLHVSDSHVTRVDSRDTEELRAFALSRSRMGRELGEHYLDEASALARQKGIPLVHTGDLVAFSGIACLEYAGRFLRTGDAVACVGNHEFWLSGERKNVESNRVECSARLAAAFPGHPVSVRRLEGLTLFVFDNASGLVSQEVADAFERVVAEGNPIALVCHVPLAAPDLEQIAWCSCGNETADERTRRFVERVRREPLVKAVLAGHVHAEHVGRFSPTAMEYVAGALFDGQAQEIEFRPASASPATNAWPFAILRNYGSYERNRTFLSRVFAAQERHPGLVDEIWFAGCGDDPFGDPERMGAAAAGENLAARPVCERLGIRFSYQQGVTLNHEADDRPHSGIPDDAWVVDRAGRGCSAARRLSRSTSPIARRSRSWRR